jgi:hypothetical protein
MIEIPSWAALLIGGGVIILFFAFLLLLVNGGSKNVKPKATKSERQSSDSISFDLPDRGYDSTGRHVPSDIEAMAEADAPFIQKIENQIKREAKYERIRKGRSTKKRNEIR